MYIIVINQITNYKGLIHCSSVWSQYLMFTTIMMFTFMTQYFYLILQIKDIASSGYSPTSKYYKDT